MKTSSTSLGAQTKSGLWSAWLEVAFVVMFIVNIIVNISLIAPSPFPTYYVVFILFMLLCGIVGGVVGLIAVIRQHERSPLVWISMLVGLFALLIFLNELMQGIEYMLAS